MVTSQEAMGATHIFHLTEIISKETNTGARVHYSRPDFYFFSNMSHKFDSEYININAHSIDNV